MQQNRNSIANARLFCIKLSIMLSTLAPTRSLINKAQVSTIVLWELFQLFNSNWTQTETTIQFEANFRDWLAVNVE